MSGSHKTYARTSVSKNASRDAPRSGTGQLTYRFQPPRVSNERRVAGLPLLAERREAQRLGTLIGEMITAECHRRLAEPITASAEPTVEPMAPDPPPPPDPAILVASGADGERLYFTAPPARYEWGRDELGRGALRAAANQVQPRPGRGTRR